jgi:hypothetical protein
LVAASTVVIRVAGTDITNKVLFDSASFESQMGALPGTFEFTIKDSARTLSFTTGAEVTLDIDGSRLYGGYLTQVTRKFAFPVDITVPNASKVRTRQWVLRGVDYNVLFDKRVLRNENNYVHHLKVYPAGSEIGALVKDPLCSKYLDIPNGFDTTTMVTATTTDAPDEEGTFVEQGSTWRQQMEDFSRWGVVYYINAQKQLYVKEVEESVAKWQFADKPNRYPIPVGYEYLPTIGFREGEFTEDGTLIVNDALVWGGSGGAGTQGVVFARRTNDASIDYRGRWQMAETHYGEFTRQARVNARANVIVDGTVSGTSGQLTRGYVNPQRMAKVIWFSHLVPTDPNLGNAKSHLRPGDITTFILYALGSDLTHPLILDLPMRSTLITFPGLDPSGKAYVQFEGTFGLQLSDPWWLWKYLRDRKAELAPQVLATITTDPVGGTNPPVSYGTTGTYSLQPAPDGSNKVFHLPNNTAYLNGSTEVYVNGLRYFPPANYTESSPVDGEITFIVAPATTDQLSITAVLSGTSAVPPVPDTEPFGPPVTTSTVNVPAGYNVSQINGLISSNPSSTKFMFAAGTTYDLTSGIYMGACNNLILQGNGATLRMTGTDSEDFSTFHLRGSNHIQIDNFVVLGAYSTARGNGTWPGQAGEGSHCLGLSGFFGGRESTYVEMKNITGSNFYGDFAYFEGENVGTQRPSHHVWIHNNNFNYCGRNAISPINVTDVLVENNVFDHMAYHTFDCEPNQDIEEIRRVTFKNNTCGIYAARSGLIGMFFSCYSPNNAPVTDITVSGNTSAGIAADGVFGNPRGLHVTIMGEAAHRYQNITFTGNTCTRTVAGSGVIYAQNTDGVTITGNTQPLSSGTLVQVSGCTNATTSPNP